MAESDPVSVAKARLEELVSKDPIARWRPHEAREVSVMGVTVCRHWVFGRLVRETITGEG